MNNQQLKDQLLQAKEEAIKGNFDVAELLANDVLNLLDNISEDDVVSDYDPDMRANALLIIADMNRRQGNFDVALEQAHRVLALAEDGNLLNAKSNAWNCIGLVYENLGSYDKALEFYNKALAIHYELGEKSEIARVTGNIGNVYYALGSYDKALELYNNALAILFELGAKSRIATVTGNIGNVYSVLGSYDKALEFYNNALAIQYVLGEKSTIASVTGNIGNVYYALGSYDKALEFYNNALTIHYELGSKPRIALVTGNIGNVYYALGSYDKALEFYNNALAIHYELGEKSLIASVTGNIGIVYADSKFDGYDCDKAEEFLSNTIEISSDIGYKLALVVFHKSLADLYENEKKWEDAHSHFKKYVEIEKEVNVEEVKKQEAIRQQLKEIELATAKADAKHQATEQLLHNVLPPSIANKMLGGTKLIAEKIPSVSVLFADIVNFTKLSQRITPEELVEGLDNIFSTFDSLAEKFSLEKIKTIGDAYMVVAGAPVQREDHAEAMANFALEMVEAMKEFRSISTGEEIQLRIGIHSGEVVAGVIGKKKFAYDLWGDAVNTASRMESHGEPGKIHCSEEFMHALSPKSPKSLKFVDRGEMEIKGKGMMKTYYLEKAT